MLDKLKSKLVKDEENPDDNVTTVRVEKQCPDGGYGWVICLVAAVIQFIILGISNNYSILYTYLMKDLNTGPSETGNVYRLILDVISIEILSGCAQIQKHFTLVIYFVEWFLLLV